MGVVRISVSGPAGSGKSHVVRMFQSKYGYATADIGAVFRERAAKRGMTIREYDKFIEAHPEEDRKADDDFRRLVLSSEINIITSWRMAFFRAPEMISIWLDVSPEEGARRVLGDMQRKADLTNIPLEEAIRLNTERLEAARQRLLKVYGVDLTKPENYAAVIDTTNLRPDDVVNAVLNVVENSLRGV